MNDLNRAPTYKTIGKRTANEIISSAKIVESLSGDFYIRTGEYDIGLTDEYDMFVSSGGMCICVMAITSDEQDKISSLEASVEEKYQAKLSNEYA